MDPSVQVRLFESLPPVYDTLTDLAVAWGLLVHLANQLDFSSTAFLSECPRESEGCTRSLTRCFKSFSSGKPPCVLRSHNNSGFESPSPVTSAPFPDTSHTRNLPPVSGEFRGTSVIAWIVGGGNVRRSSVWTHVARCSHRQRSQNSIIIRGVHASREGGTNVDGSRMSSVALGVGC